VDVTTLARTVQTAAPPRNVDSRPFADLVGALAVCGALLSQLPFSIAASAGTAAALLLVRPQVVVLAGVVAVPLLGASSNQNRGLALFIAMLVASSVRHLVEGHARWPSRATVALPVLALWVVMSDLLTQPGPAGGPSRAQLIQPLVGVAVALVASLFPIRARELAMAAVPGAIVVAISAFLVPEDGDERVSALGLNPDYLATLVVLMMAAVLVGGLSARDALLANLLVWPVGLVVLAQTQSRGAFAALAVVLCMILLGRHRDRLLDRRRLLLGVAVVLVALVAIPDLTDTLSSLFLSSRTELDYARSDEQRSLALLASLRLMLEHPLLGIGYGHFPYVASELPGLHDFVNTHNEYTRFGAELGVVGLVLLLAPFGSAIRLAAGTRSRNVLAVLLAMAAAMLTGNFLNSVVTAYPFWVALGMGLSLRAGPPAGPAGCPEATTQAVPQTAGL